MSNLDETPSTSLTDPSAMKTTTPEPSPTGWVTCTVTYKSESRATTESHQVSKGNQRIPSPLQPCKQPGTVYHVHSEKGQERKCVAEGENDMLSEESICFIKRLKQEIQERELSCDQPGIGQIRNPLEEAGLQLRPTEYTQDPEMQAVFDVRSMYAGQVLLCPYSSMVEDVQKQHNGRFSSFFGHLQPGVPVCYESPPSQKIPVAASKKISGCVNGEIPASQLPPICPDSVSHAILPNQMPIPSPLQPYKQPGTVYHAQAEKGQKKKCVAEGENDVLTEESICFIKRLKQEIQERELGCDQTDNGQIRNPLEEAGLQLRPTEYTQDPEVEAVFDVTSMYAGQVLLCPYSSMVEGVQTQHNGRFSSFFGHLHPGVPECYESPPSQRIPVAASKKISGCVNGEIPASQLPPICPDSVSHAIPPNLMPIPSPLQPCKQPGTVYHAQAEKGQKRKCVAEGENDVLSEEICFPKRLKQEILERELGCDQTDNGQIRNPLEEAGIQLRPTEYPQDPEVEAVFDVTPMYAGQVLLGPYSSMVEGVQTQHNGRFSSFFGHLQPGVPECYESPPSQRIPVAASKEISGCVNAEIPASQLPPIYPDSVSHAILPNQMPIPTAKEKAPGGQGKITGLDCGPQLTEDMQKEVSSALGPGPKEEILSRAFKMAVTREDMRTLRDSHWLNDTVINFYMNLLMARNQTQGYPALYAFNTFFYSKLQSGGYKSVRSWTKAVNLFAKELILVPVHLDQHWSLVVTDLREKSIVYLDSMGLKRPDVLAQIFQYLQDESIARRNVALKPLEWKQHSMAAEEIPQQGNGSDCGLFTCQYAEYISRGQPLTFSQQHMPLFRKKMVWEILHQCLLEPRPPSC